MKKDYYKEAGGIPAYRRCFIDAPDLRVLPDDVILDICNSACEDLQEVYTRFLSGHFKPLGYGVGLESFDLLISHFLSGFLRTFPG